MGSLCICVCLLWQIECTNTELLWESRLEGLVMPLGDRGKGGFQMDGIVLGLLYLLLLQVWSSDLTVSGFYCVMWKEWVLPACSYGD